MVPRPTIFHNYLSPSLQQHNPFSHQTDRCYIILTHLAAVSLESTAVVNLLATARATSEIKGGELP